MEMFLAKWGAWPGSALVASRLPNEDLLGVHLSNHFWSKSSGHVSQEAGKPVLKFTSCNRFYPFFIIF